jgi:hypothetical protein
MIKNKVTTIELEKGPRVPDENCDDRKERNYFS